MSLLHKPLEIHGVQIKIEWDKFIVGSSFFIPCIDGTSLRMKLHARARVLGIKITTLERRENNLWGLRVWRIA